MQHYNSEYARKMLELNPDWMAIAVDEDGTCHWLSNLIEKGSYNWLHSAGYLGKFTYDGDWKDTLVVRKCRHKVCGQFTPLIYSHTTYSSWKYCPKCGELLGSK